MVCVHYSICMGLLSLQAYHHALRQHNYTGKQVLLCMVESSISLVLKLHPCRRMFLHLVHSRLTGLALHK